MNYRLIRAKCREQSIITRARQTVHKHGNLAMSEESLKLEVRDFGPIGRADLELRPLTVFVGPSNTGKSYLAMLIYALHKHFSQFDSNNWWHAEETVRRVLLESGKQLALDVRKTRDGWSREDKKFQSSGKSVDVMRPHTWKLSRAFRELLKGVIDSQGAMLRMEIERCFGSRIEELTRRAENTSFAVGICHQLKPIAGDSPNDIELNYSNATLGVMIRDGFGIDVKGGRRRFADLEMEFERFNAKVKHEPELAETFELPVLQRVLEEIIVPGLFGPFGCPGHYLPAGRAVLLDSFDAVVGSLINQASTLSAVPPTVSGVSTDFLRQLVSLARLKPEKRNSPPSEIEEKILKGSISINTGDKIQFPQFSYKPANWAGQELQLKNASSMVSEVGPIALYDKHVVTSEQLLIVDEPESHLHPALQVELFKQLVRLVSEGKRVLVTTHSEWIAEELSNIVRRSKIEKSLDRVAESRPGLGRISLSESDVGVWMFNKGKNSNGSTVKKVAMEDTGLYATEFDDVAISLHNEWARITNLIKDDE